jgi:biopolymer transport protein ExbB
MRTPLSRLLRVVPPLVVLLLLGVPTPASAWWDDAWAYRMRVVVGAATDGAAAELVDVGRTRVLVRLHQGVFNFNNAKEDGSDLRFVAGDDRTPLKFQIERYDSLLDQVGLIWVDVPQVTIGGGGTAFYIYWGNRNAPPAAEARATFDPDTVLAYNFGEEGVAPRDSTGFANHALNPAKRDDGLVGFGQRFDGTNAVRLPSSTTLGWEANGKLTISLWFRAEGTMTGVLYQAKNGSDVMMLGLTEGVPYLELGNADGVQRTEPGPAVPAESWRHLALVAADRTMTLYVDGEKRGSLAVGLPAMPGAATLGNRVVEEGESSTDGFVGLVDNLRISKTARAASSFMVAVRGEGPRADLVRFDVPEEGSIFGTGYFGIIAKNLTHDAWVVIGICGVMAPLTWWLFIAKTLYLNATGRANKVFRRAFRDALTRAGMRGFAAIEGLDDPALRRRVRKSSLYHSFRVALEELDSRGGIQRAGNLSDSSLASIRAAIDAHLTFEGQKLNRGMVLLTIAIAGGPFIGLLGTVIGVMITFAAVAAAGDVNVNAIAPGIAAALAATVAGLGVAIPALFGYNYLLIRIRDVTADMRVFTDELVTRIGEGAMDGAAPTPMLKAAE